MLFAFMSILRVFRPVPLRRGDGGKNADRKLRAFVGIVSVRYGQGGCALRASERRPPPALRLPALL